jgi:hypothetical protein
MSTRWDPIPAKLAASVVLPVLAVTSAINKRAKTKYQEGKWTLGVPFFLGGCYLPYLLGDRYDQFGQLLVGLVFGIIGAGLAVFLNRRMRKKQRTHN